jgi:hypothetical protein
VLAVNARYRVRHETDRGKVLSDMVQLEVLEAQKWRPVRRSDSAHGQAHWHIFHRRKRAERNVLDVGFNEALTEAKEAIKNHWKEFAEQWKNE